MSSVSEAPPQDGPRAGVPRAGLRRELDAAASLVGFVFGDATGRIHRSHRASSDRVFGALSAHPVTRAGSAPARLMHDAIAGVSYGATQALGSGLVRAIGAVSAAVAADRAGPDAELDRWPAGRIVRGALSGAFGDALAGSGNPLTVPMSVRAGGRDVGCDPGSLRRAYPAATGRIAIFLHGLCETEDAWFMYGRRGPSYGARLRAQAGCTPVYIRYNSGLHISENGRLLAALVEDLVAGWPVTVGEIVFVGHSMGALVARSAAHHATRASGAAAAGVEGPGDSGDGASPEWVARTRHVFSLGGPHGGAPLERGAHALTWALRRLPETRPWGDALGARSAGIRDLGHGWLTDECWTGVDPEAFLRRAGAAVPFIPGANHYFVSASIARAHDHPLGRYVGDLLVLHDSAWSRAGRREALTFPIDNYRHVGGATHFDLLGHPAIADQLVSWLPRQRLLGRGSVGPR